MLGREEEPAKASDFASRDTQDESSVKPTPVAAPSVLIASLRAAGAEFIDENGGGPGVRLRKPRMVKNHKIGACARSHLPARCVPGGYGKFATVFKIQRALENAGIRFTDDGGGEIGVRLQIGKGLNDPAANELGVRA